MRGVGDMDIKRLFVEKKAGFDVEAKGLFNDLKYNLGIEELKTIRIINRYDISGLNEEEYKKVRDLIFAEKTVDNVYEEELPAINDSKIFAVEYLPGQYDQRADSACQCIHIVTQSEDSAVSYAKVIVAEGCVNKEDINKIKNYCINAVDSREAFLEKPMTLSKEINSQNDIAVLERFIDYSEEELKQFLKENGLAMTFEDLKFCQDYFKDKEQRNPTITEIKVIDTYWSDHCRHTTFMTNIEEVHIGEGKLAEPIRKAYEEYLSSRDRKSVV